MAGPDEIADNARSLGVPVNLHSDVGPVRTVVEASQAADRSLAEIGNVLLVTVRDRPVLVVVPGNRSMDGAAVAKAFGAEPLEVALATQEEAQEITGYNLGLIPPVGHEADCEVLVDQQLLENDRVLFPAGDEDTLLELNPQSLAELDNTRLGEFSRARGEDS